MQWQELDPQILQLIKHEVPPNYLVIHLGSNDLVTPNLTSKKFIEEIQCSFLRYNALLPNTKLVWSHILPRRYWHGAPLNSGKNIDKKRKRINKNISKFVTEMGGGVISHANISVANPDLFRFDGTHLSELGNRNFLNNVKSGLWSLIRGGGGGEYPLM